MTELKWWQTAVFYQIYPRSFADGNGDGIGDFPGMTAHLDYLQKLGVDALWLSPHFPSPQADCGYDISDYCEVAPEYGTLDDFKQFLDGAHQRNMRVILDLVLNHTSDEHPWFLESKSSRDNPKRDWYIWEDGVDGGPPNNWYSGFGGSAWEYDAATGQYYYHFFLKEQPDLNWRNPEVKQAMWDAVRFWLDMGVDGYRLDAIATLFEDPGLSQQTATRTLTELRTAFAAAFPDAPSETEQSEVAAEYEKLFQYQIMQPGVHELMQELRTIIAEYPDRVLVGESDEISFYGAGDNELHMAFNFPLMRTSRITPQWVRQNQEERLSALPPGSWPCNTLGNHDSSRVYSRYGDGEHDAAQARLSLALMLTLKGTPFLYNGEEIGMADFDMASIDLFMDNLGVWFYHAAIDEVGMLPEEALRLANNASRDKNRTPMQWANAANAGFSPAGVKTWLPVNPNYAEGVNVAEQKSVPESLLNFYQDMLHMRRETPALISGEYQPLHTEAEDYLAFLRTSPEQTCLVVLNMSPKPQEISFDLEGKQSRLVFASEEKFEHLDLSELHLEPFEIFIGELE
ncbi:MAG: alpha-glucosidase [Anaerolineales bacterium]|nr:alpha-glucosidase [Anaerolineales bacterium]